MRVAISTEKLAAPVGPFSAAVQAEDTLFCSGRVAQEPNSGNLITAIQCGSARAPAHSASARQAAIVTDARNMGRPGTFKAGWRTAQANDNP